MSLALIPPKLLLVVLGASLTNKESALSLHVLLDSTGILPIGNVSPVIHHATHAETLEILGVLHALLAPIWK